MYPRFFIVVLIFYITGCATITEKLVFSENNAERKAALISLESSSFYEMQYVARDLMEIFVVSEEKYKIRAAYSLIRIAFIMAKNNKPAEALEYCNFILAYGLVDSYGLKSDGFSKRITGLFLSNLSYVLSVTAAQRKTKEWASLSGFFVKYKDRFKVTIQDKQLSLIKEAAALNLLDNAFKDGNISSIYDIINYYKNTWTYKTAEKIIRMLLDEKQKSKGIEEKYILLNSNVIYDFYKKSVIEIDNLINKSSADLIKK